MSSNTKSRPQIGYTHLNQARLVRGGKPFFDCLLNMIASAKESIHLQTYIYDDDETGRAIADALKAAVKRKVTVYLLADGYASRRMPKSFIKDLGDCGIQFRFFDPLFKSSNYYFGRRLHHKVVVVDIRCAMVGGINISDRYNDMPGTPAWLDFAMYVEGQAVKELCILCWKTWNNFPLRMKPVPCELKSHDFHFDPAETSRVGIQRNDWVRRKNEISGTYTKMFRTAHSHITILSSYFLPGRFIRRQLAYAAQKGVRIRVITAGISDVMLAKQAERHMYNWLLKNNIELFEYQSNILHGKIEVCDSEWL